MPHRSTPRCGQGDAHGLLVELDRAGTEVQVGDAQALLLGKAGLDVGDAAVDGGDLGGDTVGAVGALADLGREDLTLGLPDVGGGTEELLEVVGGAGLVGAVDDRDVGVRKLDALVLGGDGLVVPLGDLALEDLGDGVDVQVQTLK